MTASRGIRDLRARPARRAPRAPAHRCGPSRRRRRRRRRLVVDADVGDDLVEQPLRLRAVRVGRVHAGCLGVFGRGQHGGRRGGRGRRGCGDGGAAMRTRGAGRAASGPRPPRSVRSGSASAAATASRGTRTDRRAGDAPIRARAAARHAPPRHRSPARAAAARRRARLGVAAAGAAATVARRALSRTLRPRQPARPRRPRCRCRTRRRRYPRARARRCRARLALARARVGAPPSSARERAIACAASSSAARARPARGEGARAAGRAPVPVRRQLAARRAERWLHGLELGEDLLVAQVALPVGHPTRHLAHGAVGGVLEVRFDASPRARARAPRRDGVRREPIARDRIARARHESRALELRGAASAALATHLQNVWLHGSEVGNTSSWLLRVARHGAEEQVTRRRAARSLARARSPGAWQVSICPSLLNSRHALGFMPHQRRPRGRSAARERSARILRIFSNCCRSNCCSERTHHDRLKENDFGIAFSQARPRCTKSGPQVLRRSSRFA